MPIVAVDNFYSENKEIRLFVHVSCGFVHLCSFVIVYVFFIRFFNFSINFSVYIDKNKGFMYHKEKTQQLCFKKSNCPFVDKSERLNNKF